MDPSELLAKVHQLESEIDELKQHLDPPSGAKKFLLGLKGVVDGVLAYWAPIALIVVLLVNWKYDVFYFEDIKNIGINKRSSDYYRQIGDRLMEHAEFQAAEEAFTKALEINSSNIDARHGLMKAQVLKPVGDTDAEISDVVVKQKLEYLRRKEVFGPEDAILYYWEGIMRRRQSSKEKHLDEAAALFQKSIDRRGDFVGSHLELANIHLRKGDIARAAAKYDEIVGRDQNFAPANHYLGYCNLVLSLLEADSERRAAAVAGARRSLETAARIAPRPETQLHIGDAYLYEGQPRAARVAHITALRMLDSPSDAKRSDGEPDMPLVFLPVGATQPAQMGPAESVPVPNGVKSLVSYSLSFDHALLGEYGEADKYFAEASALDADQHFRFLVANRIQSIISTVARSGRPRSWLSARLAALCQGHSDCPPQVSDTETKENNSEVSK